MKTTSILPLVVSNATVSKRRKTILKNVSVTLVNVGFTIVMGPNGSGKTTLLRLMHGLEHARSGSVKWAMGTAAARARQSFVFQKPVLMRRSVLENIAYPLLLQNLPKGEAQEIARKWAGSVELGSKLDLDAQLLSGGEQQKLAIARALISEPEVLFLDEPTTNLDGSSMREIESIIQSVNSKGTRVIMTTHDIGQARRLASDVLFLNKGEICEHQSGEQFFAEPSSTAARAYLKGDIVE